MQLKVRKPGCKSKAAKAAAHLLLDISSASSTEMPAPDKTFVKAATKKVSKPPVLCDQAMLRPICNAGLRQLCTNWLTVGYLQHASAAQLAARLNMRHVPARATVLDISVLAGEAQGRGRRIGPWDLSQTQPHVRAGGYACRRLWQHWGIPGPPGRPLACACSAQPCSSRVQARTSEACCHG